MSATGHDQTKDVSPAPYAGAFERIYRAQLDAVAGFFARRARDAQTVADLTAETFLQALGSFKSAPPARGSERAWLFAIARNVYARHCERVARRAEAVARIEGMPELSDTAIDELERRLDAERAAALILDRLAILPDGERAALELVDVDGLSNTEAAKTLGVSPVALRVRLSRARMRVRKERDR